MSNDDLPGMFELTPLNPAFREDPYPILDKLRAAAPVRRDERSQSFIITRYADVRSLATDLNLLRDPDKAEGSEQRRPGRTEEGRATAKRSETTSILHLDNPDHARLRKPLTQALYARVAKFRPQTQAIVDFWLERIDASQPFDLMTTFAERVPIDVIAAILGVDNDRLDEFRTWSEGIVHSLNRFRTPEQEAEMERCSAALEAYLGQLILERRAAPKDDLISDLLQLQRDGWDASDVEIRINCATLLIAGNLTTTDLIGNAVWLLLTHPDQRTLFQKDPSTVAALVEEVLRTEAPVDVTSRTAPADMAVGGCPIKAGQRMTLNLRAANHDPETYADPHRFDIQREKQPHLAFGGGAHICAGAPLARLEAQVALVTLFERFPTLKLAAGEEAVVWRKLPLFRGLQHLRVSP